MRRGNACRPSLARSSISFLPLEIGEPPHVHVIKDDKQLKVWLSDLRVARNAGFAAHEINDILKVVAQHRQAFLEAWNGYFGH